MDDVEIEIPDTDDADAIADLWVALADGQRKHGSHLLSVDNRTHIRESIVRHVVNDHLLVARTDDIVGFVMFSIEGGTYKQDVSRGVVENLYVQPAYRNRGIGSRLLETAESILRDSGVDTVALEVMADNASARRFYRTEGYEPHRVEFEKRVESDTHSKGDE